MPIESFFKLTFLSIHVYMELITGVYKVKSEGREEHYTLGLENAHHICMLSGFIIQSLIEVLIYYGVPFPKGVEMFFAWIGFLVQALIMTNHKEENGIEKEVSVWCFIVLFRPCNYDYDCLGASIVDDYHRVYVLGGHGGDLFAEPFLAGVYTHPLLPHARHVDDADRVCRVAAHDQPALPLARRPLVARLALDQSHVPPRGQRPPSHDRVRAHIQLHARLRPMLREVREGCG